MQQTQTTNHGKPPTFLQGNFQIYNLFSFLICSFILMDSQKKGTHTHASLCASSQHRIMQDTTVQSQLLNKTTPSSYMSKWQTKPLSTKHPIKSEPDRTSFPFWGKTGCESDSAWERGRIEKNRVLVGNLQTQIEQGLFYYSSLTAQIYFNLLLHRDKKG